MKPAVHTITSSQNNLSSRTTRHYQAWAKLGCDLFEFDKKSYLATVDYYSNVFEVDRLDHLTSMGVIRKLKPHFARYGIPDTIVTDNGPQFASEEF